jgi:LacI family gluconate utilization system Gnt-I transcriptional repressor
MFEQIVQQRPAVDAIFFCNDDLAQGALLTALRRGIRVPEQVAIVGFNDLTGSDQTLPALTTVRTPRARIGEVAAQMLLGLIKGQMPEQAQIDLGFALIERGSA